MKNNTLWIVLGALSVVAGIVALLNPFAATIAAERIAGWSFVLIGVLQMIAAFRSKTWGPRLWAGILGVLSLFIGISLLSNPLAGVISLTMMVAIIFLAAGLAKIFMSLQNRHSKYWPMVLISGLISVILALMIFANFPIAAAQVLGVLLAVELISNGVSLIALGSMRNQHAKRATV